MKTHILPLIQLSYLIQNKSFIDFGGYFGGHLGFTCLYMPEAISMYLIELLMCENLYIATNFMKLSSIEQKLWPFIGFGGHFGGHLGFSQILTTSLVVKWLNFIKTLFIL